MKPLCAYLVLASLTLVPVALVGCGGSVSPIGGGPGGGTTGDGGTSGGTTSGIGTTGGTTTSGATSGNWTSGGTTTSGGTSGSWTSGGTTTGGTTGTTGGTTSGGTSGVSDLCASLPLPKGLRVCLDGTLVGATYVYDGAKCILEYPCPVTTPPPPICDFALPNLCEACPDGTTECAHYVIRNGQCQTEVCPQLVPPPPPKCAKPGSLCSPGSGCGSVGTGPGGCTTSCNCDSTGHMQCAATCAPPPPPVGCFSGAACGGRGGCEDARPDGCSTVCSCDPNSRMQCSVVCEAGPPPAPPLPVCNFLLPNICLVCSDGMTSCAHYVIRKGRCETEICPPTSPPPAPGCSPGAPCAQGTGCGTTSTPQSPCAGYSCSCDTSGHLACSDTCSPDAGQAPSDGWFSGI